MAVSVLAWVSFFSLFARGLSGYSLGCGFGLAFCGLDRKTIRGSLFTIPPAGVVGPGGFHPGLCFLWRFLSLMKTTPNTIPKLHPELYPRFPQASAVPFPGLPEPAGRIPGNMWHAKNYTPQNLHWTGTWKTIPQAMISLSFACKTIRFLVESTVLIEKLYGVLYLLYVCGSTRVSHMSQNGNCHMQPFNKLAKLSQRRAIP